MLVDIIWVMMNLKNYAEKHGKKNIILFVLIDLKKDQGLVCVFNENKTLYTLCGPQAQPF